MTSAAIRICNKNNQELEEMIAVYRKFGGPAFQGQADELTELLDRRRAMGYNPEPKPDPERDAERERRAKLRAVFIDELKAEPEKCTHTSRFNTGKDEVCTICNLCRDSKKSGTNKED